MKAGPNGFQACACILLASILAHGWLLAAAGDYTYDGALISYYIRHRRSVLDTLWHDAGVPIHTQIFSALSLFQDPRTAYAAIQNVLFPTMGMLYFAVLRSFKGVTSGEALVAALMAVVTPLVSVWPSIAFLPHSALLTLFLFSLYLFVSKNERANPRLFHFLSMIGLFVSFGLKSLLVFGPFAFAFASILKSVRSPRDITVRLLAGKCLPFFALSVAFWVLVEHFYPVHGIYAEYNRPSRSVRNMFWGYLGSYVALQENYIMTLEALVPNHHAAIGAAIVLPLFALFLLVRTWKKKPELRRSLVAKLGIGCFLLGPALFPYVVISKPPTSVGYMSRQSLLATLPVAFLVASLLYGVTAALPRKMRPASRFLCAAIAFSAMVVLSAHRYLDWYTRRLQDAALLQYARGHPQHSVGGTFLIRERPHLERIGDVSPRFGEYTALLNDAWGEKERWVVFDTSREWETRPVEELQQHAIRSELLSPGEYLLRNFEPADPIYGIRIRLRTPVSFRHYWNFEEGRRLFDVEFHPIPPAKR